MEEDKQLSGPDLKSGVELDKLVENEPFLGHYEGEAVILVRQGIVAKWKAISRS